MNIMEISVKRQFYKTRALIFLNICSFIMTLFILVYLLPTDKRLAVPITEKMQICESDSDCTSVYSDCGECGSQVSINKKYQEISRGACSRYRGVMCQQISFSGFEKCEQGFCK
jgi:hypothetical protein